MAAATFSVRYDRPTNILRWSMAGFWTVGDVMALAAAMKKETDLIGKPPLVFDALCDTSDFPVQSAAVADAMHMISKAAKALRTGRTAIVVGSMINKFQAERIVDLDETRIFRTVEEAEAWLKADKTEQA